MCLAMVFGDALGGDMPAAIIAGLGLVKARIAIERAAVEELLQAFMVIRRQVPRIARQRQFIAAAFAMTAAQLAEKRSIVIVHAARHGALAIA